MDSHILKEKLETMNCHIHGDAAHVVILEDNTIELGTCCLLFKHQLLLMADNDGRLVK